MKKYLLPIIVILTSANLPAGKIVTVAGQPAPSYVNLDWNEFRINDLTVSNELPALISKVGISSPSSSDDDTAFTFALLCAKLSGQEKRAPLENDYWNASRNALDALVKKKRPKVEASITGLYARYYMIHLIGANSMRYNYTLQPEIMSKLDELYGITLAEGGNDKIAEALYRWAQLYKWTSDGRKAIEWEHKDYIAKINTSDEHDRFLKQIHYAILFRYNFHTSSKVAYELFQNEIITTYRNEGISFSCYYGFMPPYSDMAGLMNDIESHHQSIAINRIGLERLKEQQEKEKNNPKEK